MMSRSDLLNQPDRAWEAFEPSASDPWDHSRVAHLHRRAGFAPSWEVLERDTKEGLDASVERLLQGDSHALDGRPASAFAKDMDAMAVMFGASANLTRMQGCWFYRMIFTPHPLRERMTLFWHDHFATSNAKVNNLNLMRRQNDLLRENALGDFRAMLVAMARDPAMLIWLDSTENRKAHPNENYAREVMELFSLGRGHYTEKDIQEAARAFTGGFVLQDRYRESYNEHDNGKKTIFGQTGRFYGDDVSRILLEQPACAEFLCTKLYRHFLSEVDEPSPELIAPLAEELRTSDYDIAVPVRTILRSRLFHDPAMRHQRVKSPVEFTVGTIRALEILKPTVSADAMAEACGRMGQSLFAPPSVAGWDGGREWINTTTTLARTNFVLALINETNANLGKRLDPLDLAERHGALSDPTEFYTELLLQDALAPDVRRSISAAVKRADGPSSAAREAAVLVLTALEYQLA